MNAPKNETWWEFLQRSREEMLEQGYTFRSKEEIDADRASRKEQDEKRRRKINRARSNQE